MRHNTFMGWKIQHIKYQFFSTPTYRCVLGGPQEHIPRWTHRTRNIVIFMATIYYSKRYKVVSAKGKKYRQSWSKIKIKLLRVLTQQSFRVHLISPAMRCDNTCKVLSTGEFINDSMPKILLGVSHVNTLCLACTKIPDSQKKSRYSE